MLAAYMCHQQISAVEAAEAERKAKGQGQGVPGSRGQRGGRQEE